MADVLNNLSEIEHIDVKKRKLQEAIQPDKHFSKFTVKRILTENSKTKTICVEGRLENSDEIAIVMLEKSPFNGETVNKILSESSETDHTLQNDIYNTFNVYPDKNVNGIKASLIHPATEKHIAKYSAQKLFLISETPEDYLSITVPYLAENVFSIQWVYNILEKKTEADRIVFEDEDPELGFILLPDMKWNREQINDLYLVAIVRKHGIKSIRELTDAHLPLLKNILDKGLKAIKSQFDVPACQLRVYLHYQPSYYHLHVHFTHVHFEAPGSGVERAHLLTDVIDNLTLDPQYYTHKKTLTFMTKESDGLLKKFQENGRV